MRSEGGWPCWARRWAGRDWQQSRRSRRPSENSWGYTRIKGALKNLGHEVGRNTIKRVLKEDGIDPAPERGKRMSWATFIKAHLGVIVGMDFFTVEAMTWLGLVRYHVLFAIDIANRKVEILGIAVNPGGPWMEQMARNLVDAIDECPGRWQGTDRGRKWRGRLQGTARRITQVLLSRSRMNGCDGVLAPDAVSVADLANHEGVSRKHFSFLFRERTGLTPAHFSTQVRVHEAARMLIETRLPLKEIASACGFANANHFSKVFRRLQHLSPASYRRTMR